MMNFADIRAVAIEQTENRIATIQAVSDQAINLDSTWVVYVGNVMSPSWAKDDNGFIDDCFDMLLATRSQDKDAMEELAGKMIRYVGKQGHVCTLRQAFDIEIRFRKNFIEMVR